MDFYNDIAVIVNLKEFRRLQDKTQLFYTHKGDHYRTRLTHTIEVCDIALRIAQKLKKSNGIDLNESLIIAIAYGHDIGHTPFGHVGERVISDVMSGYDDLGGLIKNIIPQWFKHNIHSYRILSTLTNKNISWQVLDGVLKHTEVFKENTAYKDKNGNDVDDPYLLNIFLCGKLSRIKEINAFNKTISGSQCYHKFNCALTLEGQIVALADEIAQRASDFDDAVRSGYLTNNDLKNEDERPTFIKVYEINYDTDMFVKIKNELIAQVEIKNAECTTFDNSKVYLSERIGLAGNLLDIKSGKGISKYFKDINDKKIIQNIELRKCDSSSKFIIRQLYKAYYNDIDQLSNYAIDYILYEFQKICKEFQVLNSIERKDRRIALKVVQKIAYNCKKTDGFILGDYNYKSSLKSMQNPDKILLLFEELSTRPEMFVRLSSIIVRQIGYYIAGMTDSFAREEFKRLYGVKMPMNSY